MGIFNKSATLLASDVPAQFRYTDFGEFAADLIHAAHYPAERRPRLIANSAPTHGSESVGTDGGFAVPVQFVLDIQRKIGEDSLLGLCDVRTSATNALAYCKDESAPWDTTSGAIARWESEAVQHTESAPALTMANLALNKIVGFVPVTDELLDDAPGLGAHLLRVVPEKLTFRINEALIGGTGAGTPLGIINSGGTIEAAAESGQTAGTVTGANLVKMWSRLTPASKRRAVWITHPDLAEQLPYLVHPGAAGNVEVSAPLYGSPTAAAPFGTLLGRPIFETEAASAPGSVGDIVLADLSAYLAGVKALRTALSIHLYFDHQVAAFKATLRVGGQPFSGSTIPSYRAGSPDRAHFVSLAART